MTMTTPQFNSPMKPDCRMVELLHRGHDGWIPFHIKRYDDDRIDPFQSLVSLPAKSLPGLFEQLISELETDAFFGIHGMYRGHFGKNRKGYRDDEGKLLPNGFRDTSAVRWLTSNFVDLDCKKLGLEPGTVIGEVIRLQDAGVIPPASVITRSGNGVWLFWILSDDSGQPIRGSDSTIVKWSRVQAAILGRFARFGSDANARDAARVTRIPGSINSKAGLRVKYWLQLNESGQPFTYELADLAEWFDVNLTVKQRRRIPDTATDGKKNIYQIRASKGQRGRWAKALANFRRLWELRGTFREGTRNAAVLTLATILYSTPRDVGLTPAAIAAELDELFLDLDQPQGQPYTRDQFSKTVMRASKQRLANHAARNQTFADMLEITPEEAELLPTWPAATSHQDKSDQTPSLTRPQETERRRLVIAGYMRERRETDGGFPTGAELVELVERYGLSRPSPQTVANDLAALGYVNPRKRRPRKDADQKQLFPPEEPDLE